MAFGGGGKKSLSAWLRYLGPPVPPCDVGVWRFFFFQAEDGIRDLIVTGVQTCALPICSRAQIDRARRRSWPGSRWRTRRNWLDCGGKPVRTSFHHNHPPVDHRATNQFRKDRKSVV